MMGFYDTAVVYRIEQTTDGTGKKSSAESTVFASLPCRMAPLDAKIQKAAFGDYASSRLLMEWGEEVLSITDVVSYRGKRYKLKPILEDAYRPAFSQVPNYQTAALTLEGRQRTT